MRGRMSANQRERLHLFLGRHRGRIWLLFILGVLILNRADYPQQIGLYMDVAGGVLIAAAIALRFYAEGHAGKRSRSHADRKAGLITTGPYALTRNPKYLGNFLAGLGLAMMTDSPLIVVLFVLLFFGLYGLQVEFEEKALLAKFGTKYLKYRTEVPRWFPRLRVPPGVDLRPRSSDFRYEWISAAIGILAAGLVHFVKHLHHL